VASLGSYTNANGEVFTISETPATGPASPDLWPFYLDTVHPTWGKRRFRCVVAKSLYSSQAMAEAFLPHGPLASLKQILDDTTDEGSPFVLPIVEGGWLVY
jgi:hypothetical protein